MILGVKYEKIALAVVWGTWGGDRGGICLRQEVVQFFVSYGSSGYWGVILAGSLFAIFGGMLLLWAMYKLIITSRSKACLENGGV